MTSVSAGHIILTPTQPVHKWGNDKPENCVGFFFILVVTKNKLYDFITSYWLDYLRVTLNHLRALKHRTIAKKTQNTITTATRAQKGALLMVQFLESLTRSISVRASIHFI